MRRIYYIASVIIFMTGGCTTSHQVETASTMPVTREVIVSTAPPTLSELLLTSIPTSTPERVYFQEPILVAKFVFPYDYLTIKDLYFIDENNGWAVGHTEWYQQTVSSIACCQSKIFNTIDGGVNWNEVDTGIASGLLNSIVWSDPMTGYIVGQESFLDDANALILRTSDAGKNWKRVDGNQQSGT